MIFSSKYKCLSNQAFSEGIYSLVPIRYQDRLDIMKWRNEQIYHLRQSDPLTEEDQNYYFENVVSKLFEQDKPNQILFSYLENGKCIGYGGLVHINWKDKNAEISFIMNTELEKDFFEFHWHNYLSLIERAAFDDAKLHKILTFAFDIRPHFYNVIEKVGYKKEGKLKDQYLWNNKYYDGIIHAKLDDQIYMRKANANDLMLYYEWANDTAVRLQSFNTETIDLETHKLWFGKKLEDQSCSLFLFENRKSDVIGQVRIEIDVSNKSKAIIGISIDKNFRGKGLASKLLKIAIFSFFEKYSYCTIEAYIKSENIRSIKSFEDAGFVFKQHLTYQGVESVLYILNKYENR